MSDFFDSPEASLKLRQSLESWRGVPFLQYGASRETGVDCVRFIREVFRDCGVDVGAAAEIPRYSLAWGVHSEHSQLIGWLLRNPEARERLRRVDRADEWKAGDLLAIRRGQCAHHAGVVDPGLATVWHVDYPAGVVERSRHILQRDCRIVSIFRLRAP